jgi:excisionase family DNA binding protein
MSTEDGTAGKTLRRRGARLPWDAWRLRPLPGNWITLGEASEDLGISRQAVHRLVERETLRARRVGRRPIVLVRERDVRALPLSPQRRRELERDPADLGDGLPGG